MGSGCLGCFIKSKATTTVDVDGSKDVLVEEHWSDLRNPSVVSEDFWTNTTLDMESNTQGSVSSISKSNLTVDSQGGGCSSTESAEVVNHGISESLVMWNQSRQQWVGNKKSESWEKRAREPVINENVTYESLLGSNKRFQRPIPLDEMVQFLVEVWEEEGLYA